MKEIKDEVINSIVGGKGQNRLYLINTEESIRR